MRPVLGAPPSRRWVASPIVRALGSPGLRSLTHRSRPKVARRPLLQLSLRHGTRHFSSGSGSSGAGPAPAPAPPRRSKPRRPPALCSVPPLVQTAPGVLWERTVGFYGPALCCLPLCGRVVSRCAGTTMHPIILLQSLLGTCWGQVPGPNPRMLEPLAAQSFESKVIAALGRI